LKKNINKINIGQPTTHIDNLSMHKLHQGCLSW